MYLHRLSKKEICILLPTLGKCIEATFKYKNVCVKVKEKKELDKGNPVVHCATFTLANKKLAVPDSRQKRDPCFFYYRPYSHITKKEKYFIVVHLRAPLYLTSDCVHLSWQTRLQNENSTKRETSCYAGIESTFSFAVRKWQERFLFSVQFYPQNLVSCSNEQNMQVLVVPALYSKANI